MKVGIIVLIGRPNAGKSSLTNALVGEKVAIVSPKPQTTRHKISGVLNEPDAQIVFLDTPGIFKSRTLLDEKMETAVKRAVEGVDAAVYVLDGSRDIAERDLNAIKSYARRGVPLIVAVNKCDLTGYGEMYPRLAMLQEFTAGEKGVKEILCVSALKRFNVDKLKEMLKGLLPEGEPLYDVEDYTDQSLRFMAAEIIREKALLYLSEEIPHGVNVEIAEFKEREDGFCNISAEIICEKQNHKQIIIGKDGAMAKKIGVAARIDIEKLAGADINLQLFVKVRKDWRNNNAFLKDFES